MSSSVTIVAVGDLQLGDSATCVGFGFRSRFAATGLGAVFTDVRPFLRGADLAFSNLETPLSPAGLDPSSWRSVQMRGEPGFARSLRRAGFSIVNVANNHAMQHGAGAFEETLRHLVESGVQPCGRRGTGPWCSAPVTVECPTGSRIGVLGYCLRPRQYGMDTPLYAEGSSAQILEDVARLRLSTDHVAVSLHWGEEFVDQPSAAEVALARRIIEVGASFVLGHHPHVLRPVERYAHGVIAYSLGNFVGDMIWQPRLRRGAILRCVLDRSGVRQLMLTPTRIDGGYIPRIAPLADSATVEPSLHGLEHAAYWEAARRTVRSQQFAVYRHALLNLWRYPPTMLAQLATATIRHKLTSIVANRVRAGDR